jgi:hypothetical protein
VPASADAPPAETAARSRVGAREAVIRDVDRGGTLRTGNFLLAVNLLGCVPLAAIFGGMGLMATGICGWMHTWSVLAGLICVTSGMLAFASGVFQAKQYAGLLEGWYARRRLLAILALRPDPIVAVNNPAAEMVNMTRRENWEKVQLDVRDDVGLLEIDPKRGELRIEGDVRRYTVPCASIVACQPECFHHPLDKQMHTQYWYVRFLVRTAGAEHELLIAPAFHDLRARTNANRLLAADDLAGRIVRGG